jgi:hypothetical protein
MSTMHSAPLHPLSSRKTAGNQNPTKTAANSAQMDFTNQQEDALCHTLAVSSQIAFSLHQVIIMVACNVQKDTVQSIS